MVIVAAQTNWYFKSSKFALRRKSSMIKSPKTSSHFTGEVLVIDNTSCVKLWSWHLWYFYFSHHTTNLLISSKHITRFHMLTVISQAWLRLHYCTKNFIVLEVWYRDVKINKKIKNMHWTWSIVSRNARITRWLVTSRIWPYWTDHHNHTALNNLTKQWSGVRTAFQTQKFKGY